MIMRPSVKSGKDRKKTDFRSLLRTLKLITFFLWFSLTQILKTKPTLSNFTNISLAVTKTLLLTCFRFEKKITDLTFHNFTLLLLKKNPSILLSIVAKNIQGTLNIVNVHVNNN